MAGIQSSRSIREKELFKRYEDLLEIARLVSWCTDREYLIKTCLDHISQRLDMRARCVFREGEELKLHCWVGRYHCPMEQVPICKESIVWKVMEGGIPVNLTEAHQCESYGHTLAEKVKIKAVIPLWYVDSITQEERRVGTLIADSGKKGAPISHEDFEYLKVVGELIGAAVGKTELTEQLIESFRRKEGMVKETSHAFRNRLTAIGGFSRCMVQLAKNMDLAKEARMVYEEVQALETQLERFEKYIGI